jgi:uncharacterized membrane protein
MEEWLMYSLIVVIIYTVWTILYEEILKKHDDCACMPLKMYMIVGILALIYFIYHVKHECKHGDKITHSLKSTNSKVFIYISIIAVFVLLSNRFLLKAIVDKGNSGYVYSITNMYIIMVTILSAYLYNTKIEKKHIIGIVAIIFGSGVLAF